MNRKLLSALGLGLAAILFFAVNIISDRVFRGVRLDLTEGRLYTLSEGTKKVLASLDEPITLRFFFSSGLADAAPDLRSYGSRVRDLLEEYADLSGGKIRLEVIDPEPFSDAEDRAVGYGLQGLTINAAGDLFYFGLAGVNSVDDSEVIPFFASAREQFLEYDLTKLVYALSQTKKPVIGVISSLPLEFGPGGMQAALQGRSRPYAILRPMRQFFDVRMLGTDVESIDDDVDVLLLVHPRKLGDKALYAIDQFVMRGGRAMVFVDPFSETAAMLPPSPGMPPNPSGRQASSDLERLFSAWGVELGKGKIVGDRTFATRVNAGDLSRRRVVDYLSWLTLRGPALDRSDVVTAELDTVILASAGYLKAKEGATTTLTPLIRSTANSMLIDVDKVRFRPDPDQLLSDFKADEQQYVLAARLSGPVKSAFTGPPESGKDDGKDEAGDNKDKTPAKPHLAEAKEPLNVILVADVDMLDERFWLRRQSILGQEFEVPINANADFLINGLDNLSGSSALISLRSRARSDRPFKVIDDLRRTAEQQFLAEEKALQEKLKNAEQRIAELQTKAGSGGSAILSAEETREIENFRKEMLATRKQLRAVQRNLRKDIESLEMRLKFVNIGLVPLAVFLAAIVLALVRYRRRRMSAALKLS